MSEDSNILLKLIKSRKSVRNFIFEQIKKDIILEILECGRWAPSGNNTQPWKVCVIEHPTIKRLLAEKSKYGGIIDSAYVSFCIFLDLERGYDRTKDIQAIGAFIQNILLAVHSKGLGAVWIGEILDNKEEVLKIFKFEKEKFELMGVIAIGVIDMAMEQKDQKKRDRRILDEFIDWY